MVLSIASSTWHVSITTVFRGKMGEMLLVIQAIKFKVVSSISASGSLKRINVPEIIRAWFAAEPTVNSKSKKVSNWVLPNEGLLKLNFNGCVSKQEGRAGYGGIIQGKL